MKSYIENRDSKFLVVIIPEDVQIFYKDIFEQKGLILAKPQDDLTPFFKGRRISYLDLLPGLQEIGGHAIYFKYDRPYKPGVIFGS